MAEERLVRSSLLAAVSALGLSLGVAFVAQAQTADELAGGGRKGAGTAASGCPNGLIGEQGKPAGQVGLIDERKPQAGFIDEQGKPAGFINEQKPAGGGAQLQGYGWGEGSKGAAMASNQSKSPSPQSAVSRQFKQGQAGAYEFYTPRPNAGC